MPPPESFGRTVLLLLLLLLPVVTRVVIAGIAGEVLRHADRR